MKNIADVAIITLGCRTNQYESEEIARALITHNFSVSFSFIPAKYYILNTCSITATADKKSRQLIARVLKLNPIAKIIVIGCSSEKDKNLFIKKQNVVFVSGTQNKPQAAEFIIKGLEKKVILKNNIDCLSNNHCKITNDHKNENTVFGVRQHLKIQDGCDNFCTYCIIPYLRKRSISYSLDDIIEKAKILNKTCKEIVVTGINMSDFKIDGKLALPVLAEKLGSINARFRFGSLEARVISEDLIKAIKKAGNICPHFHLSMQSGCDKILKDMNRHYTSKEFIEKVNLIRENFDNPFIACDIIVGFPTETEEDFNATINTILECKFSNIHIFPYSKREGTAACKYKLIDNEIVKQREEKLIKLNNQLNFNYKSSLLTKNFCVLIESYETIDFILYSVGYSENYIKFYLNDKIEINSLINVSAYAIFADGILGEII